MDNIYRNFDECDKKSCVIIIDNKPYEGFSINSRIRRESVPSDLHLYEIDGYCKSENKNYTFKIKTISIFNCVGTILTFDELPLNDKGFIKINPELVKKYFDVEL